MNAIECKNVTKTFWSQEKKKAGEVITAIDNISFAVQEKGIYALLGRNGAGKTTLLNMLCTKCIPNEGEVLLFGEPAYENEKQLKNICFMSDHMPAFDGFTVKKILAYAKAFYESFDYELCQRLLKLYEVKEEMLYSALSKGRQTAFSMIIGLCSNCGIVLFDEIYSGLDAVARQQFYEILMEQQEKNPRTYILSTHLIEEMSGLFTDVIIIDRGKLILTSSMEDLRSRTFKCTGREEAGEILSGKNILDIKRMGPMAQYLVYDELSVQDKEKLLYNHVTVEAMTLQEFFIAVTGRSMDV